ncbi:gliding motility-associated C-terminal domain-containing protein [Empedobacter sp. 225-1]|uniref:T9SS type B sorting domain-containing protein n=1 Tax=unclassified Empedobacter TaxID=2643773 RepID=UPI002576BB8E|nr:MULTISPECIES: T9SS type B sorting domain-containing protein [unclassified Empedobacter]MDM1523116.1 gliding motility-associated C-terminal domain-containing protein [Empedobacter sp. 225-1]MDM1542582.1 gliding motility-associated C-terminal domain-containing protein [Empedobacter sp. 189-2]
MKKIFYFLLLMISGVVWGQRPTIYPLEGGFTFKNQTLDIYTSNNNFSPIAVDGCAFNTTYVYKYFSFKANFDMVFAFDLIANKPDFKFLVWKLPKGNIANDVFVGNSATIKANRAVEGNVNNKGMKEGVAKICEYDNTSSATGYAKAFEGSDLLKKDETIVIAVYGINNTDTFDIKVNVAEERTITVFNNFCQGKSYTYSQIYDGIKDHVETNPNPVTNPYIKVYTDNTFSSEVGSSATFTTDTTLYAQVKDVSGDTKYIYTIPLKFIPEHQFNFKPTFETEYACTPTYTIPDKDELLNKLFPTVDSNYSISSIVIDGTSYTSGQNVNLAVGQTTSMKIKVHYGGGCPIDSHEVSIPLVQGKPTLSGDVDDATCDSSYKINFDRIYSKLGKDKNAFDLIVTLGGLPISDGQTTAITTILTYKVKIKSRTGGGCESDEVDFVVTKTSPANILPAEIKDICFADFTQSNIDNAISIIQNGNSYNLKFYQEDGLTEITDLLAFIKTTKNGKIIVKALAVDNGNTICDTGVELIFELDESNFDLDNDIPTLNSSCSEVGAGNIFKTLEIEDYLKKYFGRTDITFSGISEKPLSDDESEIITFQVKINGEDCWTDEMQLTLQVITKPNVVSATLSDKFCEGESLTIDDNLLRDNFGANVFDYKIYIEGVEYIRGNPVQRELDFGGNTSLNISVEFKNRLSDTCSTTVDLTVNKKPDLIVDILTLENYTQANPIIYCEGEDENAKSQIEAILKHINSQASGLVAALTVDEIFAQIDSNEGFVNVVFEDPNYCGTATIKFYFKRNPLPTITVPEEVDPLCFNELYSLDFTTQTGYDKYTYIVEKVGGTRINGVVKFELDAGIYNITIEDKITGCSVVKTLDVKNAETPTIEKITINETSIIVTVKGNGKLEYALFGSDGNIIVDWQTKNELIIPDKIADNNFTVKVRLNGCGVSERKNVIYLALPNVVTPNQDGRNDVWKPMTKNGKINDVSNSYKLIIFDRYGKQILLKEGIGIIEWDGTHNGKPVADGTYWYMLEFSKQSDDLKVLYSGSILVKRKIK